jgi:hypothetical protein
MPPSKPRTIGTLVLPEGSAVMIWMERGNLSQEEEENIQVTKDQGSHSEELLQQRVDGLGR